METKPSILIIYTGGTIGMVQKSSNGALVPMKFDEIQEEVPELDRLDVNLQVVTFSPPIDSSNMTPTTWIKIANTIERNYNKFDGFVILHGTDTMAYTASALSYMFENLDKPIVLTGSQLPIGILRTDGKENLITSIQIASAKRHDQAVVPEVCVYFNSRLFRGNRISKRHADDFSAFSSVNYPPLAIAGVEIKYFNENIHRYVNKGILKVRTHFDENVVVLKIFPGIGKMVFENILNIPGLKGVVLESFGSGNIPTSRWMISQIKNAIKRKIIILNVTQCQGGAVNMTRYETGVELEHAGVVSGKDMTTEAAVTKLMFLLGQGLEHEEIKLHLNKSLIGEMSE
ncbi:MAG TPA: asparaginase [Prolixibacteraceae bacterium]|nr:asparaginase [Prolixibacteraceae bacterium]